MQIIDRKKGSFIVTDIALIRKHLNALVDTGSSITVVDLSFCNLNKPYQYKYINSLHGRSKVRTYKEYVHVTHERKEVMTTLYFMDLSHITDNYGKSLQIKAILGMDVITKTKLLNV